MSAALAWMAAVAGGDAPAQLSDEEKARLEESRRVVGEQAAAREAAAQPPASEPAPQTKPASAPPAVRVRPCTYAKLRDGSWGARSTSLVEPGEVVTVRKGSGEEKRETIDRVLWTDGRSVWLCALRRADARAAGAAQRPRSRRGWRPCGYPGCNPGYCDECDGEGYRPGR